MYLGMVKRWFASLYHNLWRKNLMRSGMLTGLVLAGVLVGLAIGFLAAQIGEHSMPWFLGIGGGGGGLGALTLLELHRRFRPASAPVHVIAHAGLHGHPSHSEHTVPAGGNKP